jgi:hypothetical protein
MDVPGGVWLIFLGVLVVALAPVASSSFFIVHTEVRKEFMA